MQGTFAAVFPRVLSFGAGIALGLAYFAGLWWTSRRLVQVARAGLFFFLSFGVRMAALLGGLWYVTGGRPLDTALAVAGIAVGRRWLVGRVEAGARTGGAEANSG